MMKLDKFKSKKLEEFRTLVSNNRKFFPIELEKNDMDFIGCDGIIITTINGDETIDYKLDGDDEINYMGASELNVEDLCYIIDIIEDEIKN